AVVGGRVVARGNIDGADGVSRLDAEGDDRRRNSPSAEMNRNVVCREDFRRRGGEMLGTKPAVAAYDDPARYRCGRERCFEILGKSLRAASDVIERVVVGNSAAPAVGA